MMYKLGESIISLLPSEMTLIGNLTATEHNFIDKNIREINELPELNSGLSSNHISADGIARYLTDSSRKKESSGNTGSRCFPKNLHCTFPNQTEMEPSLVLDSNCQPGRRDTPKTSLGGKTLQKRPIADAINWNYWRCGNSYDKIASLDALHRVTLCNSKSMLSRSNYNISKLSEANGSKNVQKELLRHRSEVDLTNRPHQPQINVDPIQIHRTQINASNKPPAKSKSQSATGVGVFVTNKPQKLMITVNTHQEGGEKREKEEEDEDEEGKIERIVKWLSDVERNNAEPPLSPYIIDEGPQQSDTAIHVVYEGD